MDEKNHKHTLGTGLKTRQGPLQHHMVTRALKHLRKRRKDIYANLFLFIKDK